jgi:hypothetical protein
MITWTVWCSQFDWVGCSRWVTGGTWFGDPYRGPIFSIVKDALNKRIFLSTQTGEIYIYNISKPEKPMILRTLQNRISNASTLTRAETTSSLQVMMAAKLVSLIWESREGKVCQTSYFHARQSRNHKKSQGRGCQCCFLGCHWRATSKSSSPAKLKLPTSSLLETTRCWRRAPMV